MPDVLFTGPVIKSCAVLKANAKCAPGADPDSQSCLSSKSTGINQRQITLNSNEELLGPDAVKVWATAPDTEGLVMAALYNCLNGTCLNECPDGNSTCAEACVLRHPRCCGWAAQPAGPTDSGLTQPQQPAGPTDSGLNPAQYGANHFRWRTGKSVSPLEVELNHSIWMPSAISFNAGKQHPGSSSQHQLSPESAPPGGHALCQLDQGPRLVFGGGAGPRLDPDWLRQRHRRAVWDLWMPCPPASQLKPGEWCENYTAHFSITGVDQEPVRRRQHGRVNQHHPAPRQLVPISTWNSTLPAVPFSAKIVYTNDTELGVGHCVCTPPQVCD